MSADYFPPHEQYNYKARARQHMTVCYACGDDCRGLNAIGYSLYCDECYEEKAYGIFREWLPNLNPGRPDCELMADRIVEFY